MKPLWQRRRARCRLDFSPRQFPLHSVRPLNYAIAFAVVGGIELLFLGRQRGLLAQLIVVRGEPCVKGNGSDNREGDELCKFRGCSEWDHGVLGFSLTSAFGTVTAKT